MRTARTEAANGRPERLWNEPEAESAVIQRKEGQMDQRAPSAAAPMRTFATLAVLMAAGLTLPAAPLRPGPARPHPAAAHAAHAAGGTVTETITSAYRTGR